MTLAAFIVFAVGFAGGWIARSIDAARRESERVERLARMARARQAAQR